MGGECLTPPVGRDWRQFLRSRQRHLTTFSLRPSELIAVHQVMERGTAQGHSPEHEQECLFVVLRISP